MAAFGAYEIPGFVLGVLPANQDMSSESSFQFTAVDVGPVTGAGITSSEAALIPPPSAGASCIGVLQNNPSLGEAGTVMHSGVTKMQLGASLGVGTKIMVNSSGQAVAATSGNYVLGRLLETGVLGDIASVFLTREGKL